MLFAKNIQFNGLLVITVLFMWIEFSFASEPSLIAFGIILGTDDPKGYKITRNEQLGRHIGTNSLLLYEGDRVIISRENTQVTVLLGGTEEKVITRKDSPYEVPKMTVPTVWSNLANWFSGLSTEESSSDSSLPVSSKGQSTSTQEKNSLKMNLLPVDSQDSYYLLKGKRPLYLGWSGGQPPYAVKITKKVKENCEEIVDFLVSSEPRIKIAEIDFNVGVNEYKVTVRDNQRYDASGQFSVVGEIPNPPKELETIKNEEVQQVAQTLWLKQQGKKWLFEVYQRVSAIAEGNSKGIAEEVRTQLEQK